MNSDWLFGWDYQTPIEIDGNTEGLTDYQVQITLQGTDSSAANYIDFDKVLANGADIRFTDSDKITEIDFWIEEWVDTPGSESATIWLKVPSLLTAGTKTVYVYYGKSDTSNGSNGTSTFPDFFDDFTEGSAGMIEWSTDLDEAGHTTNHAILKDERIYVTTGKDDVSSENYLYIFDANTGAKINKTHLYIRGCVAAPKIINNYIYVYELNYTSGNGTFEKFDITTLLPVWHKDIAGTGAEVFATDDTYAYLPLNGKISKVTLSDGEEVAKYSVNTINKNWGSGTILVNGLIYYRAQDGYLKAINASDMTLSWEVALDKQCQRSYNTPIYISEKEYVVTADCNKDRSEGTIYAINANSHTIVWNQSFDDGSFPSILCYANGRVFAGKYDRSFGQYIALDIDNGNILWQADHIDPAWHVPTPIGDYIVNYKEGVLSLINVTDGSIVYTKDYSHTGCCGIGIAWNGLYIVTGANGIIAFRIGESGVKNNWLEKNYDLAQTGFSEGSIAEVITTDYDFVANGWTVDADVDINSLYSKDKYSLKIDGTSGSNNARKSCTHSTDIYRHDVYYTAGSGYGYTFYAGIDTHRIHLSLKAGYLAWGDSGGVHNICSVSDGWHTLEVENVNWTTHTYDIYLNGDKEKENTPMEGCAALDIIRFYESGEVAYIDNILVRKYTSTEPTATTTSAFRGYDKVFTGITNTISATDYVSYSAVPSVSNLVDMTLNVDSTLNLYILTWGSTYKKWNESCSDAKAYALYAVGDLTPNTHYTVSIYATDNTKVQSFYIVSSPSGYATYKTSGYGYDRYSTTNPINEPIPTVITVSVIGAAIAGELYIIRRWTKTN